LLSEWMVESLLVASITGAGLVLAILNLVALISEDLLTRRAKILAKTKRELMDKAKKAESETPKLVGLAQTIASLKDLPVYLGLFLGVSFACFVLSALLDVWWFLHPAQIEELLELFFGVGVLSFFIMGVFMITDVESLLRERYEEIKKEEDRALGA